MDSVGTGGQKIARIPNTIAGELGGTWCEKGQGNDTHKGWHQGWATSFANNADKAGPVEDMASGTLPAH